mgnify:CR=1 FL=1
MIFVDDMKNMKIYKKPMYLPTVEKDKKHNSAVFLLTPNYESSKRMITNPMLINRLRFESYYLNRDVSYYITGKVGKKLIEESYVNNESYFGIYDHLLEMTASEKNKLKDSDFGIPSKKKYPMPDVKHIKSAIRFFNYVDKEDEKELAENIIKAAKKYNVDLHPGKDNRLSQYVKEMVDFRSFTKRNIITEADKGLKYIDNHFNIIKSYGIIAKDNSYNACVKIDCYNKPLRARSEVLIFKDGKMYICVKDIKDDTDQYRVPGGGWNKDEDPMNTAIRETQEEALMNIKNIRFCMDYTETFPDAADWVKDNVENKDDWWYGYYTKLYIADYDSPYTGKVEKEDKDDKMAKKGFFAPIEEYKDKLNKYQQKAIDMYLKGHILSEAIDINDFNAIKTDILHIIPKDMIEYITVEDSFKYNKLGDCVVAKINLNIDDPSTIDFMINTLSAALNTSTKYVYRVDFDYISKSGIIVHAYDNLNESVYFEQPGNNYICVVSADKKIATNCIRMGEFIKYDLIQVPIDVDPEDILKEELGITKYKSLGAKSFIMPRYTSTEITENELEYYTDKVFLYRSLQEKFISNDNHAVVPLHVLNKSEISPILDKLLQDLYLNSLELSEDMRVNIIMDRYIRYNGYSSDIRNISSIITPEAYYNILTKILDVPIRNEFEIPLLSITLVRDPELYGKYNYYMEEKQLVLQVNLPAYDSISDISNYINDVNRYLYLAILYCKYPASRDTHLAEILVDYITNLDTRYKEYAKYMFIEENILASEYSAILDRGDVKLVYNLLSKKFDIRITDLTNEISPSDYREYNESRFIVDDQNILPLNENNIPDSLLIGDVLTVFNENSTQDAQLRRILYNERIKQRGDLLVMLNKVKEDIPIIKYAYPDIEKYKKRNLFVDLYYYNELFFKNNSWKLLKAAQLYGQLLDRLINDPTIDKAGYTKKTIFIPILDWHKNSSTKMWMYREDINPISFIYELLRTESLDLKRIFKDINLVFFGNDKLFKFNISEIDSKDYTKYLVKFRLFIDKILNNQEFEVEDIDTTFDNNLSSKAKEVELIDKIETAKSIDLTGKASGENTIKKNMSLTPSSKELKKIEQDEINKNNSMTDQEKREKDLADQLKMDSNREELGMPPEAEEVSKEDKKRIAKIIAELDKESDGISAARSDRLKYLEDKFMQDKINDKTIEEILSQNGEEKIETTDLKIATPNEEWKNLTYMNFDKDYDLNRDVVACFNHFAHTKYPVAVRKIDVKDNSTSEDRVDLYTVEMEDFKGQRFTIKLDIPKMKDNRFLLRGNNKYILTQFFNMPILKTDFNTSQVVSNYQKIMIYRVNTSSGRGFPISSRIIKALDKYPSKDYRIIKGDNSRVCKKYELPIDYIDIASYYSKIESKRFIIYFNQDEIRKVHSDIIDTKIKGFPFGYDKKLERIFYYYDDTEFSFSESLMNVFSYDESNEMNDLIMNCKPTIRGSYSECSILNSRIPMIVCLCYLEGMTSVLKKAHVEYQIVEKLSANDRSITKDYIKFSDGYLVYKVDYNSSILMNGIKNCSTEIYSIGDIDSKNMYYDFLDDFGGKVKADGLENFYDCLIDPMTKECLEHYNLPTDFVSVILYAGLLLADNNYVKHTDIKSRRIRRNELIAAYTYEALSEAYGNYANEIRHNRSKPVMSLKQSVVIDKVLISPVSSDDSIINALNAVETTNSCTYKGKAGLNNDRSYSLDKRNYDPSMLNVVAMSTGFSANVGLTRQATMDMNIDSTRGYIKSINNDTSKMNAAKSLCATEALTPFGTTRDDAARVYMTFIQTAKHAVRTEDSDPLLVTNGADEALPYMTTDKFAFKAKKDGKVIDVTDNDIIVEYKDGAKDYINLKETVEKNSDGGYYVPLKLEKSPKLAIGKTFKSNDILAYDPLSFSNSAGESDNLSYNVGKLAKVAIINTDEGFEDSGMCTQRMCDMLATRVIEKEDHTIDKDANVLFIAKIGDKIEPEQPLIIWNDPHEEEEANTLMRILGNDQEKINEIGRKVIRSEVSGVISDIKIYRTVEIDELSESLQKIVNNYERPIKQLKKKLESLGVDTSELPATYKLAPTGKLKKAQEAIFIEFYLEAKDRISIGDKITYFSANKATIKTIVPEGKYPYTDSRPNEPIDCFLSVTSVEKRMISSISIYGSIQRLMIELDRAVKDKLGIKYDDSKL